MILRVILSLAHKYGKMFIVYPYPYYRKYLRPARISALFILQSIIMATVIIWWIYRLRKFRQQRRTKKSRSLHYWIQRKFSRSLRKLEKMWISPKWYWWWILIKLWFKQEKLGSLPISTIIKSKYAVPHLEIRANHLCRVSALHQVIPCCSFLNIHHLCLHCGHSGLCWLSH